MSLLPNDTFVNSNRALWAVAGSGGGGGGSTLQSPASIVPEGGGDVTLNLISSTGSGEATLNISSTNGNTAQLQLINTPGGSSGITMGVPATEISIFALSLADAGKLGIGSAQDIATANMIIDTVNNNVQIGNTDPSANIGSTVVNTPLTYSARAGAPKAGFPAIVLGSTSGSYVQGNNSVALGGLAAGLYAMYGDTGASTNQNDLDCRFNSIVQINPAGVCSGGAGGADTGWNLSPNGTGGLTLELTNAPTAAFSVKAYPIYLF